MRYKAGAELRPAVSGQLSVKEMKTFIGLCHCGHSSFFSQERILSKTKGVAFSDLCQQRDKRDLQ